jgi:hypothetical protein
MKKSAFEIATKWLQPEDAETLADMKAKMQTTVRRKDLSEIEEEKTSCPACSTEVPFPNCLVDMANRLCLSIHSQECI